MCEAASKLLMTRWIISEAEAAALEREGHSAERAADPLRSALGQPSAVVLMKPAADSKQNGGAEELLLLTVRHREAKQAEELGGERKVVAYEATGLLGLLDEAVYSDTKPKPRWWRR